jgi:hypothetical protein
MLFVEGEGDVGGVRTLVKRLLSELNGYDALTFKDQDIVRLGGVHSITGSKRDKWTRLIQHVRKKGGRSAGLVVLDGDWTRPIEGEGFCASVVAKTLVARARDVGAGTTFSLAVVFARQEFESWLLAGIPSLAGQPLGTDKRQGVRRDATAIEGELEESPRDAKGRLKRLMQGGYNPVRDQADLTAKVDLDQTRNRGMRSFRRLEHAVQELVDAARSGNVVATPS